MKKYLLLMLFFAGCTSQNINNCEVKNGFMTNEEIIIETQKCENSGLKAVVYRDDEFGDPTNTYFITKIECRPK